LSYAFYILVSQVKLEGLCCDSFSNSVPEALGLILMLGANNSDKRFSWFYLKFPGKLWNNTSKQDKVIYFPILTCLPFTCKSY